jgi:hypothetical protein
VPRIGYGHTPSIGFSAQLRAFVQVVRQHEVERDGVVIITETEVSGDRRSFFTLVLREDKGALVGELVVALIDELAVFVQGSETTVLVEDVVMLIIHVP